MRQTVCIVTMKRGDSGVAVVYVARRNRSPSFSLSRYCSVSAVRVDFFYKCFVGLVHNVCSESLDGTYARGCALPGPHVPVVYPISQ